MNLDDLKAQRRWVCYNNAKDKAPINPRTGDFASSTDPATWATYDEAKRAVTRYRCAGVGVVFTGDGLVGIDIDDGIKDGGEYAKYTKHLLGLCYGYAELSPSGTGVHLIGRATIPRSLKRLMNGVGIEVYDKARYFTFTGEVIEADGYDFSDLGSVQDVVDTIFDEVAELDAKAKPARRVEVVAPSAVEGDERDRQVAVWIERAVAMMRSAVEGNRHNTRIKAGRLLGGALAAAQSAGKAVMDIDDAVALIYDAGTVDAGEEDKERSAILWGIESGMESPLEFTKPKKERPLPPPMATTPATTDAPPKVYHLTDLGNGQRFADTYRDDLLWVPEWAQWMHWDDRVWQRVDVTVVRKLAHDVIIAMYASAKHADRIDGELGKWAIKSETTARINAMVEEAKPYLSGDVAKFDTAHDLVNVGNGIVNLRTAQLMPHDRTQYFTKLIDIDYDPSAKASTWRDVNDTIFAGDRDLMDYIQRAVGYTLTGRTDEHCLFFCYGIGKNGKSTFMAALQRVMGDYATTTSVEALLDAQNKGEAASPYMARLPGKRIAVAQEMPEGRRMNESLIKSITGGDRLSTRDLYKSVFEFDPTHHLWISGNHKPRISGTDDGIWRRLRIIPFTVTIPEEKRKDSRVIEADLAKESSGILGWMVRGAQMWYAAGLGTCDAVKRATDEYRTDEDALQRFISEECEINPMVSINKHALYAEYKRWAEDENDRAAMSRSQKFVVRHLVDRFGCTLGGQGRNVIFGIKLNGDAIPAADLVQPRRQLVH